MASPGMSNYDGSFLALALALGLLIILILFAAWEIATHRAGSASGGTGGTLAIACHSAACRAQVRAFVVFATSLGAVDALLGGSIAYRLEEAALPDLTAGSTVEPILELVDGPEPGNFGLVKSVCSRTCQLDRSEGKSGRYTCLWWHTKPCCPW